MFRRQKCFSTVFCLVTLFTLVYDVLGKKKKIETTTQEASEELTEPILDLDALLDVDGGYGVYSTQKFEYVNWQHHLVHEDFFYKYDKQHVAVLSIQCSMDHIKCISNLEIPSPVCGYFYLYHSWYYRYKVFESYCHVYLENCLFYHRRYRMLNYGGCYLTQYGDPERWPYPPQQIVH